MLEELTEFRETFAYSYQFLKGYDKRYKPRDEEIHGAWSQIKEFRSSWSLGPNLVACGSVLFPQPWELFKKGPVSCLLEFLMEVSLIVITD